MVRLSQIVKKDPPQPQAAPQPSGTPPVPSPAKPSLVVQALPSSLSSQALAYRAVLPVPAAGSSSADLPEDRHGSRLIYEDLVAATQRCLDSVHQQQRIALDEIPVLVEQVVNRLVIHDSELIRLATLSHERFSLAAHSVNVAVLTMRLGLELDMKPVALVDLGIAALLHDIGMMKFPRLLQVSQHLNPEEVEAMREHPLWGERIARRCLELPSLAREVIIQEHERADGSGYPNRLAGSDICEHAQLVGLMDVYEALIHNRPYRRAVLPANAARILTGDYRSAFNRESLRVFLRALPVYPIGSWVRLTTGAVAKVLANYEGALFTPVVQVFHNRDGEPLMAEILDLLREPNITISEAVPAPV